MRGLRESTLRCPELGAFAAQMFPKITTALAESAVSAAVVVSGSFWLGWSGGAARKEWRKRGPTRGREGPSLPPLLALGTFFCGPMPAPWAPSRFFPPLFPGTHSTFRSKDSVDSIHASLGQSPSKDDHDLIWPSLQTLVHIGDFI